MVDTEPQLPRDKVLARAASARAAGARAAVHIDAHVAGDGEDAGHTAPRSACASAMGTAGVHHGARVPGAPGAAAAPVPTARTSAAVGNTTPGARADMAAVHSSARTSSRAAGAATAAAASARGCGLGNTDVHHRARAPTAARDARATAAGSARASTVGNSADGRGGCSAPAGRHPPRARARGAAGAAGPPSVAADLTLRTATGLHALPPARLDTDPGSAPPPCTHPQRLAPFLAVALRLMAFVPRTSEMKLAGAIERFMQVTAFWGVLLADVTWHIVVAFVTMRCAPPIGALLPACCGTPVLPATAAGDVDSLRRAARLGLAGMQVCREALESERVTLLLRAISARVKRLRTAKRALLFEQVRAFWQACVLIGTAIAIRDGFAVVVAFFFAMRVRELLALCPDDIEAVHLHDGRVAMRVTFRSTKTRQSVFATHEPFVVASAHELLIEAWAVFEEHIDYYDNIPLFHALRGSTRDPLSRAWFAGVVARAAPGVTPHSCRVGCASEMWAARVPLSEIMAHGRWTSIAAVLYIVGSLEDQVSASDAIGSRGALMYSGDDLRKVGLGGFDPQAEVDADRWAAIVASLPMELD